MMNSHMIGMKKLADGLVVCGITMLCAGTAFGGPPGAVGDLYVVNLQTIIQVDSATGAIVGDFASDGMSCPLDSQFGPNGNLFVANLCSGTVTEYDGDTGSLIGTFTSGLSGPGGIRFEENGNLLVFELDAGRITEVDTSGNLIGTFASGLSGDVGPMDFGPDGNLYVSNLTGNYIQRFAPDGTDLGIFAAGGSLSSPESHVFGPNGNLFVCSPFTGTIVEFDGTTGALVGDFISTHLNSPVGIAFGPDGNAWVSGNNVLNEFDGTTGEWIQEVAGFLLPATITVKPASGPTDCLTMTVSMLTGGQNASWDVSGATPGALVAVIYGLQAGSTVVSGQSGFCATFGIKGVNQSKLVGAKVADGSGNASIAKKIPGNASGLTVLTQAAEQGTCPDECVSGVDTQVVQ